MLVNLKIVPDAEPNADGRWIEARVPTDLDYHTMVRMVPVDGHHVVAVEIVRSDDTQSMLAKRPDPSNVYQFRIGWLRPLPPADLKSSIRNIILDHSGLANDASTSKIVQAIFDQVQRFSRCPVPADNGWVCFNQGPDLWFWLPDRESCQHELSSEIRPATALEKHAFFTFGRKTPNGWCLDARRRVRHIKCGSTYRVIGEAEVQVSTGEFGKVQDAHKGRDYIFRELHDGSRLTIYQSEDDGRLLARFCDEFNDGRFEDAV